jgi:hypothetical protein
MEKTEVWKCKRCGCLMPSDETVCDCSDSFGDAL